MYFSSVLQTMRAIKEAQKKGLKPPQYQIAQNEITSDYISMVEFYERNIQSAPLETLKGFKNEVNEFYLVVKDMYLDLETEEMATIYNDTREKRESLIYRINTLESQSEQ